MIFIVSNGSQYSDHRLFFVEAPSLEDVQKVLMLPDRDPLWEDEGPKNPRAKILGSSATITWLADRYSTMTLEQFRETALDGL
jgi:hypothetical protein